MPVFDVRYRDSSSPPGGTIRPVIADDAADAVEGFHEQWSKTSHDAAWQLIDVKKRERPPIPAERVPGSYEWKKARRFPREQKGNTAVQNPLGKPWRVNDIRGGLPGIGHVSTPVAWCVMEDGFIFDPFDVLGSTPPEGGKLDIERRTHSLLQLLTEFGHDGITHLDAKSECLDQWHEDYAIICDAWSPYGNAVDSNYFDADRAREDWDKLVKAHFACDPTVKIQYYGIPSGCGEIEITRKK